MFRKFKRIVRTIVSTPPIGTWEKWLRNKGVDVKGHVNVDGKPVFTIWGRSTIVIEDGVTLQSNPRHNEAGIVHPCTFFAENSNAKIYIGKHTGMSGALICCEKSIHIGNYVGLGANVSIYDTDFHPINPYSRLFTDDQPKRAEVFIDDFVWVGANSMILKGVHIGKGAVIGAGSVVTKDVPPYTIYAGNPAKFIREINCTEEQLSTLEKYASNN